MKFGFPKAFNRPAIAFHCDKPRRAAKELCRIIKNKMFVLSTIQAHTLCQNGVFIINVYASGV